MFLFERNDWIWGADRNQNSQQQVAGRITTQGGSCAGRPYASQKAQTRRGGKQNKTKKKSTSFLHFCTLLSLTTLHTKLPVNHPHPASLCLHGDLIPAGGEGGEKMPTRAPLTLPLDQTRLCSTARSGCGPTAAHSRSRGADTQGRGFV